MFRLEFIPHNWNCVLVIFPSQLMWMRSEWQSTSDEKYKFNKEGIILNDPYKNDVNSRRMNNSQSNPSGKAQWKHAAFWSLSHASVSLNIYIYGKVRPIIPAGAPLFAPLAFDVKGKTLAPQRNHFQQLQGTLWQCSCWLGLVILFRQWCIENSDSSEKKGFGNIWCATYSWAERT